MFFWLWVGDHLDFTLWQRNGTSNSPKWRNCFTTKRSNRQMDGNHNMSDRLLPNTKCPLQEFLFFDANHLRKFLFFCGSP